MGSHAAGSPRPNSKLERSPPKSAVARRNKVNTKPVGGLDPYSELADRFYGKTGGFNIRKKSL